MLPQFERSDSPTLSCRQPRCFILSEIIIHREKGSNKQSITGFDKIEVSKRRGLAMQHEERIAVTQTKKSLGKDVPEKPFKGYEETCFGPYSDLITDFGSYGWR
ncbi:hypothetical protein, partial [Weissella confusa]